MTTKKLMLVGVALAPLMANAGLADKGGLSGEISLISGVVSTDSNLSTSGSAVKNAPLNSQGSRETDALFGGLGNLAFTFGEGLSKQLFVGTSREDIAIGTLALEMGYRQQLASGTKVSLSYLPTLLAQDVWTDPYVTDANRSETEKSGDAYRLKLDNIGGSLLSLDLAYAQIDIDSEQSGNGLTANEQNSLKRSGDTFYSKLSYRQFLGRGLGLTPSVVYIQNDADGDAMANQTFGGELTYFSFAGRNKIVLTGKYLRRDFDAVNPVFGIKREDTEYGAFLAYEFSALAGIEPLSFITLAGYSNIDSNIDFYASSQYLASIGITYRF